MNLFIYVHPQDHFPLWYRSIHILNCPRLARLAYQMIRPMLNQRVRDTVVFHDSDRSLHQYVDKEVLPEELGGSNGRFDSHRESAEAVLNMKDYFRDIKNFVYPDQRTKD